MAQRKKTTRLKTTKTVKRSRARKTNSDLMLDEMTPEIHESDTTDFSLNNAPKKPQFFKIALVVLVIAAVAAIVFRNRSWLVAATVNGQPIPTWELNSRLTSRFGNQVLEAMIGEKLISSEASKQGVAVSQAELAAKIAEVELSLKGQMKLDDALSLQGVSRQEFENQLRIQLMIDKMLGKEVSISAQEIDEFIGGNAAVFTASDPAGQRLEAEAQIKNNKIAEKFQEWFANLKEKSQINRFIAQ